MNARWPCLEIGTQRPRGGTSDDAGCLLHVSVVPNAPRTTTDGLHGGALRLRLAAPPVDGKANEALVTWLARELGLRRSQVQLLRGQNARRKTLRLAAPAEAVAAWLGRCVGSDDATR